MSKAIQGAAMLAGAVGIGVAEFFLASSGVGLAAFPWLLKAQAALVMGGISMEAGAIASALTSNRGMNITTRQAAGARQIIKGVQRVGGNLIYPSTTGSHKDQYNKVIVLSGKEIWGIEAIYLDGRRVYFDTGSSGNSTRNGLNFGGSANGNTYTGPDGQQYNFGNLVYVEARYGDQLPGDVIGGLTANDPAWAAAGSKSPYVGGCAYLYVKVRDDASMFPGEPEIRVTVHGDAVFDPRSGDTVFSANAALVIASHITDPIDGLGMKVNQAQLIAAANVCDESVSLAAGGVEARYTCHHHYDTSAPPGDVLAQLLASCAGEISVIGGEVYIWPAYWQGPSFSFDDSMLSAEPEWSPTCSFRELSNRITGTYTAPNYPYNVAGNLYDANGFDAFGNIQDNFQFGFQPTSIPQYAADQLHGYAADEYLNYDSGVTAAWTSGATFAEGDIVSYTQVIAGLPYSSVWESLINGNIGNTPGPASAQWVNAANPLPMEVSLPTVLSLPQAQRVLKINLLRNRNWGSGTFEMFLGAFAMQEKDVMQFTFPLLGWVDKKLEIKHCTWKTIVDSDPKPGDLPKAPERRLVFDVKETSESIYEWDPDEEQSIYSTPVRPQQQSRKPAPPTNMSLTSSAATAIVQPDGTVIPRIEVQWDTPLDGFVRQIESQYQVVGDAAWTQGPLVDVALNLAFISGVIAGKVYNVRIRSRRASGAVSDWVEEDGTTAGLVLSTSSPDGLAPDSLIGEAFTDGTAAIICEPFTAIVGSVSVSVTPTPDVDTGLAQGVLYYVYYVDPTFAGGAVTAIATTDPADFRGLVGYYFIGSKVTPTTPSGGSGSQRYVPTSFSDLGTRTTRRPTSAFDGDTSTSADASATYVTVFGGGGLTTHRTTGGAGVIDGFPNVASGSASTLTVVYDVGGDLGNATVDVSYGATSANIVSTSSGVSKTTALLTIPSSTLFNTIAVSFSIASGTDGGTGDVATATLKIYEVFIDT